MEIDYSSKFKLIDKLKKSTEWNNSIIIGMTKKKITETTHQSSKKSIISSKEQAKKAFCNS